MRPFAAVLLFLLVLPVLPAQERQGGELLDLSNRMLRVEAAIRRTDTGRVTQSRQQRIIDRLQVMIEALQRQRAGAVSSEPLVGHEPNVPPGKGAKAPAGQGWVEQRWIGLRPRERARIESEVTRQLPARYKRMLERYYQRLGRSR